MPCETPLLTPERVVFRRTAIRRRCGNRRVRPSRVRDGADPHPAWARPGRCRRRWSDRTVTPSRRAGDVIAPDEDGYPWVRRRSLDVTGPPWLAPDAGRQPGRGRRALARAPTSPPRRVAPPPRLVPA